MTIDRIWVSTTHSVQAMIEARQRGVDLGTALDPWDGIVVILSRERELATALCQAIRHGAMGSFVRDDPDGPFRGVGSRQPYAMLTEGRGRTPEFLLDFGAHLHRDAIRTQLDAVIATKRQTFITTMNPAVLDLLEFADAEQWRRGLIFADADGARHMTAEDAAECARSYGNGVLRVSEIVRMQGLW